MRAPPAQRDLRARLVAAVCRLADKTQLPKLHPKASEQSKGQSASQPASRPAGTWAPEEEWRQKNGRPGGIKSSREIADRARRARQTVSSSGQNLRAPPTNFNFKTNSKPSEFCAGQLNSRPAGLASWQLASIRLYKGGRLAERSLSTIRLGWPTRATICSWRAEISQSGWLARPIFRLVTLCACARVQARTRTHKHTT